MRLQSNRSKTARVDASEAVHTPLLWRFPEVVAECGGDVRSLLRSADISGDGDRLDLLSYRQMTALLELTAAELNRPDFGLMLARRQFQEGMRGPLGEVMRHAQCFGDVLDLAVRHSYAHSIASNSWLQHAPLEGYALLGHDIVLQGLGPAFQIMEQILLLGHYIAIRLTGGAVRARRIFVRHRPLSSQSVYRSYFGCDIRFEEPMNATLYWTEDLARPIVTADETTLQATLACVKRQFGQSSGLPINRAVRAIILHALDDESSSCDRVAEKLNLHTRTLHRYLRREGTSFRRIKDDLRRELAEYFLRCTDLDMKTISERLGFSEQSALSRRSRKWFDGAPTGLRSPDNQRVVGLGQVEAFTASYIEQASDV